MVAAITYNNNFLVHQLADLDGSVPLWEAIRGRNDGIAKLLWDKGARLSDGDEGGFLCKAIQEENIELLYALLNYDIDINAYNKYGATALHVAILQDRWEVVDFLVQKGADLNKGVGRDFLFFFHKKIFQ